MTSKMTQMSAMPITSSPVRDEHAHPRPPGAVRQHTSTDVRVGDDVLAQDGRLGRVEEVLRAETEVPTHLVVAVGSRLRRRYPVVPWAFVVTVDHAHRRVHVRSLRAALGRLPETLPLVA